MTNYNPNNEPTDINEQILFYIDDVMHDECETDKDIWTLTKILSCELFGMTICRTCHKNREKLVCQLISKWKDEYDYPGVIRRGLTKYRELPYEIKRVCQEFAMNNIKLKEWTPNDIYEYGRKFCTREIEQSEVIDLKISNAFNERNIEYLIKRFAEFEKQCITTEMLKIKKQFPNVFYDY
jgi:hypothetical protein